MGFDSKCELTPPTILLGLLLCPWTWGISSQQLQRLPSYGGFSDLGCGVSPRSRSSAYHHTGVSLTLDVGYLLTAAPAHTIILGFLWPWMWGISSHPVRRSAATAPDLGHGGISSRPLVTPMAATQPLLAAAKSLQSCPTLCNPRDGSPPGPPSLGFSRQEYWSGLSFPSPMHESEKWKWSHSVVSNS